ncbi:MAG: MFS transporter [Promethearchaeota archaeon]
MIHSNSKSIDQKTTKLPSTTPDFNAMIRITFWNGLGFIFFTFIKSYVVIYYFGGTGIDLGIIMALQPLARLFSMPVIAYLTDHTSKKRLVLIGSMGRTIAYFLYWFSLVVSNLYIFGVGTFIQGILVGFFWPPFFSLISEKSFKGNRTQALATGRGKMIGYGFLMGALISIPLFAIVSISMPDNIALMYSPLLIFSAINLIAGLRFHKRVDETLTFENFCRDTYGIIIEDKINDTKKNSDKKSRKIFYFGFASLILAILATSITGTIYSPFISAYLINNLLTNFSGQIIPIIVMIVYFPAQVLSQLVSASLGKSFDRVSPLFLIIIVGILKAIMIWLLIFAFTPVRFAIILIFLFITTESNSYLIQAIMSRISIKHRGKVFGLHMWIDRLGRVIGPLIGGILWVTLAEIVPFIISIYIGLGLIPLFVLAIRTLSPFMVEQVDINKMGLIKIKE